MVLRRVRPRGGGCAPAGTVGTTVRPRRTRGNGAGSTSGSPYAGSHRTRRRLDGERLAQGLVPHRVRAPVGGDGSVQPRRVRQDRRRQVDPGERDLRRGRRQGRHRRAGDAGQPPLPGQGRQPRHRRHPGPRDGRRRQEDHRRAAEDDQPHAQDAAVRAGARRLVLRARHGPALRGHRGRVRPGARRARAAGDHRHDPGPAQRVRASTRTPSPSPS